MSLILAQSFMKQLKRLPQKEQGVVSRTVLDLQMDPTAATLSLHKVDGDAGWWSAYANGDLRIILARQGEGEMVLCWTDHHDKAYLWARRHVLTAHPVTKSMQIVEIPEVAATSAGAQQKPSEKPKKSLCAQLGITREDLLGWGVPEIWVEPVLQAVDEDRLLEIGERHLPPEAAEVVLSIAVGEMPQKRGEQEDEGGGLLQTWNSQSWWVVSADDDLKAALENANWDSWCVYLHPSQRKLAYRTYDGPYRVCGSAGTGKTVVALHHAKHILSTNPDARVLVVTYSGDLAKDLKKRLRTLMTPRELERCEARAIASFAKDLYERVEPSPKPIIHRQQLRLEARSILTFNKALLPKGIGPSFALSEFERIVEPRQIRTEDEYLRAIRRGVHVRLSPDKRRALWAAIGKIYEGINSEDGFLTTEQMFAAVCAYFRLNVDAPRYYTDIIVDECQDLCEVELDFLVAYMGVGKRLFFAGDLGQRIIRFSFPWTKHGIDLRGRSRVLKVNYRTTHEIRSMADRLTNEIVTDADDISANRKGTVSLLSGPKPEIRQFASEAEEIEGVARWLDHLYRDLEMPAEAVAIFIRSDREMGRAIDALRRSVYGMEQIQPTIVQMFKAKGLEYRAAVVMACDNGVIPSPDRLAEADLVAGMEEIYDTERNLLYVACTRARDYLLITSAGTPSELLLDMIG